MTLRRTQTKRNGALDFAAIAAALSRKERAALLALDDEAWGTVPGLRESGSLLIGHGIPLILGASQPGGRRRLPRARAAQGARIMSARCHLCGSAEVRRDSPVGSPTCDGCWPITGHLVSMQTGRDGASLAVCRCGWRSEARRFAIQDVQVRLHWRDVIRRKMAALDSLNRDPGGAAGDLKTGAIALALLCVNLVGWLVAAGVGA